MTTLWIRADASQRVGLGHVMRTMAIAEVARERGHPVRYAIPAEPWVVAAVERRGFAAVPAPAPSSTTWLRDVSAGDLVVFDGYGFTTAEHERAREAGAVVAVIDDRGSGRYDVDVVVNQNPVSAAGYAVRPATRLLVGPRYALVRREFAAQTAAMAAGGRASERRRSPAAPSLLLLTFGGSDVAGLAPRVIALLDTARPFERVRLVVGPGARDARLPERAWLEVVRDPPSPGDAFAPATAALSAAGSTTWELLALGIPLGLVEVAPNQRVVVEGAVAAGAALDAGAADGVEDAVPDVLQRLAQPQVRNALSAAGRELVDGRGADRVFAALVA